MKKYTSLLVTGGAGFIGSNLALYFKRAYPKLKVTALDNLKRRGSELNLLRLKEEGVDFIHGDIRTPEDLVLNRRFDLVFECSAEPSVMAGSDNPAYLINTNLSGTINCLEFCRKQNADIIFLSTSRVYPYEYLNSVPVKETATRFEIKPTKDFAGITSAGVSEKCSLYGPKSLYGATKLASEFILQEYLKLYGIKGIINRCGVVAGPWQFGKVDQGVFTLWMLAHFYNKPLSYIGFGGEGKQVRDFMHVDDLCRLLEAQVKRLSDYSGEVYNVGGGRENSLSLLETTELCRKLTGIRIKIASVKETRPADVKVYLTDAAKVSKAFGWKPQKNAQETLFDIYAWIQSNERKLRASLSL